ncbi:MAG: 5-carboxymethyl-2-hydroxymuconate Delta-isomerase [Rhodospirillaceae bacterium]|nr:5-carboxymethyl-2-hydroxymuconate Delta-isomerase [Rhodospirillaceae bacterium]MDE0254001.1 5-carboxymethyl-2-hydroxymuconate Delta-isomerase [Rhodospirillaceae bacterium]MDE0616247.1 5-carboxymethyl-2-hydroxymuconate Delta-isomerase [Rhodospirillaceae bacterium]
MPHFRIEYSRNLEEALDLPELFERLTGVAAGTGVFPLAGIRCRALPRDSYRVADGHPDNGFVHVELRVGAGRDIRTLRGAGEAVFAALNDHMAGLLARRPVALSFEIAEIHPDLNFKAGTIRDHMKARAETAEAAE